MDVDRVLSQLLSGGSGPGVWGMNQRTLESGLLVNSGTHRIADEVLESGAVAAIEGVVDRAGQRMEGVAARTDPTCRGADGYSFAGSGRWWSRPRKNAEPGLILLRAMIASASAAGRLDGFKLNAVFDWLHSLQLGCHELALMIEELMNVAHKNDLIEARTDLRSAAAIYTASLLAADPDSFDSLVYLEELSRGLELPRERVEAIDRELGIHPPVFMSDDSVPGYASVA